MNCNYLTVTEWIEGKVQYPMRYELTKRVRATGHRARLLATAYETELNGGKAFDDLTQTTKGKPSGLTVCAIPYHAAREYRNFDEWENCPYLIAGSKQAIMRQAGVA